MTDGEMLPLRQARVSNTEHGLREAGDDLWGGLHHDTEMIKAALKPSHYTHFPTLYPSHYTHLPTLYPIVLSDDHTERADELGEAGV